MPVETDNSRALDRPLTILDVARMLGVSKSTVSAAFTGKGNISAARRQAVRLAAEQLGYQPNPHAQRLIGGRSEKTVNIITFGLDLGILTHTVRTIQWRISERGYDVPINVFGALERDEKFHSSEVRALRLQRPRAMIINNRTLGAETVAELNRYVAEGGHLVCYGDDLRVNLESDFILFDQEDSMYQAARHLLERGHREIGFSLPDQWERSHPRFQGFCRALAEYGLEPRAEWLWANANYEDGGVELAKSFLLLERLPTAMCIVNDVVASTFAYHLQHAGLRVPQDVSIVSQDDTPAAAACTVPLTTVSYPQEWMTSLILDHLFSRLDGIETGPPRKAVVRGDLIQRQSVAERSISEP